MSVSREEMLIEANRRGLLKGDQKAQFDEAVKRGLIQTPFDTTGATGLRAPGNLDPWNRKVLNNPDGSVSTTSSISIGTDQGEVLIPTVVDGVRLSNADAIKHYRDTGQHFGIFDTPENADMYAQALHEEQARRMGLGQGQAASPARGTPEYKQAKAAELASEVAKFSGKLTPEQSSDRLNFMGNAGASFVANLLSIPHASGELLKTGGDALQAGAETLAAKVMGKRDLSELITGQPATLASRYAAAQSKPSLPSSLLLKFPDPDASDVMTAARSVMGVPGQIGESIRAFQQGGGYEGGQTAPNPFTDVMAAFRNAREAQAASEEQFPGATTAGRTVGDIATMLTLRPSARIAALARGTKEVPAATEAASGLNAAVRKVAGGLGKSAEAGFDGAVTAALGNGDPAKTAAYSAGVQAAGSAALEAKGYLMRQPLKSFATLFLAHQMWKAVLPGDQNVFESQDKAVQELVGAYSLGVLASAAGAGRPTGPIASALSSASRAGIASVITQLQEADKQGQTLYDRVLTRMTEDPEYFGREARDKLERAANSDKPRALLDEIDQLMGSSWFKQKYDALTRQDAPAQQ